MVCWGGCTDDDLGSSPLVTEHAKHITKHITTHVTNTIARSDTGLWLSLGGFQETGPDAQHMYNTHVLLDAGGATAAAYRKVCLLFLLCMCGLKGDLGALSLTHYTHAPTNKQTQNKQHKIHLFDVDVPNGPILMESRAAAPGRGVRFCGRVLWLLLLRRSLY